MSTPLLSDNHGHDVIFQCSKHPAYEGFKQSQAYLNYCPGCRAVYWARKARNTMTAMGNQEPFLRLYVEPRS